MIERHILKMSCGVFHGIVINDDTGLIAEELLVDKAAYRPEASLVAYENEYVPWKESIRSRLLTTHTNDHC